MKVDRSKSLFHEAPSARTEFNRLELKRCRVALRRLQFLEARIREDGGLTDGGRSGGAAFAEWEADALEWLLDEIGFLAEREDTKR